MGSPSSKSKVPETTPLLCQSQPQMTFPEITHVPRKKRNSGIFRKKSCSYSGSYVPSQIRLWLWSSGKCSLTFILICGINCFLGGFFFLLVCLFFQLLFWQVRFFFSQLSYVQALNPNIPSKYDYISTYHILYFSNKYRSATYDTK